MVLDEILKRVAEIRSEVIDTATETLLREQKVLLDGQPYDEDTVSTRLNTLGFQITIEDKRDQVITVKLQKLITIAAVACKFTT